MNQEKKVDRFNFKRPDRISKNQIRSLHSLHDRFARNLSSSLSAYFRSFVEIALLDVSQINYGDFLATLSEPTCYSALSLSPLEGTAGFELSPALAFPMIDRLLGGEGSPMTRNRPMTEIEQSIINNVLKLIVENLKKIWRPVYAIDFSVTATETYSHMVQVTTPNEMVIQLVFETRIGDTVGKMNFAIPTLVLEPMINVFDQKQSRKETMHSSTLVYMLRNIPINVSIETASTPFAMESLLSLQVGDTIVLDQREEWPLTIKLAGREKFLALAQVTDGNRRAFAVTSPIRSRKEELVNG